ncbi:MAG: orotidine-5'-phosphate decarboxylase, partial [Betaproteobacteria bacterium]|nr:orotidine-5'-phosphate decarboxylase [Betaproteobacteria bacterium]
DAESALALVDKIGDAAGFYKIGLELFAAGCGRQLISELKARGLRVFADLKLFDVPATVARAVKQIAESGADFLTVHGNDEIMKAAADAKGENLKILAVTALTSLDDGDLRDLGFVCDAHSLVLSRARRALACGCDGVVSSGLEVRALRQEAGEKLILVTPGVRPVANTSDDQKRTATPAKIIGDGGDYLVAGRPVRDAENPRAAAQKIVDEIAAALGES